MTKKAMILSYVGTSIKESLNQLKYLEEKIKQSINNLDLYICFTSEHLSQQLQIKENIYIPTIEKLLIDLKNKKYLEITILPLQIIPGIEYKKLINTVLTLKNDFYSIDIKKPLLYSENDITKVCNILNDIKPNDNSTLICVAHDTKTDFCMTYDKLQNILKELNYKNIYITTLKGSLRFENIIPIIKEKNIKEVYLYPLTLTHSTHVKRDIFGQDNSCYSKLKSLNIKVNKINIPLCQIDNIISIYISHLKEKNTYDID